MFSFMPRNTRFFDLFESAAKVMVRAAEAYAELGKDYGKREEMVHRIRQLEHDGDETTHRTLETLDKTFITPFDREDIQRLIVQMDDVVDEIDAAAKRLILYRIDSPTPWLVKQTDVLLKAASKLHIRPCDLARVAIAEYISKLDQQSVESHQELDA